MGSEFDSMRDAMTATVRDVFGTSWTYTTLGGTSYSVNAIFDEAGKAVTLSDQSQMQTTTPSLDIRPGDLPIVPEPEATATDGSRVFHVSAVERMACGNYLCHLREVTP